MEGKSFNKLAELDNSSFFPEDTKVLAPTKKDPRSESVCEVKLCTSGRLSAPPILHFYDYNMAASQVIAELANSEETLPVIARVLNTMVLEEFDCRQLHKEEIREILLNIHAKWWGPTLEGYSYFLNPELDIDKKYSKENISTASLPISNLVIKPLSEKILEPINIPSRGITLRMVYPRAQNYEVTQMWLKTKFALEEQKFFQLRKDLDHNSKYEDKVLIDLVLQEEYENFLITKANERLLVSRAQCICGVDDRALRTLEERVEELRNNKQISVDHWDQYNRFLEEEGAFGLQDEVEFYSEILDQKVTRPFRFLTYNFIPQVDAPRDESNPITFG